MPYCATKRGRADEIRAGLKPHGKRHPLDRNALPVPDHRFTVSRSGRESLREHGGMMTMRLSRTKKGTKCAPLPLATTLRLSSVRQPIWAGSGRSAAQQVGGARLDSGTSGGRSEETTQSSNRAGG